METNSSLRVARAWVPSLPEHLDLLKPFLSDSQPGTVSSPGENISPGLEEEAGGGCHSYLEARDILNILECIG